jgi:hypothetical protein
MPRHQVSSRLPYLSVQRKCRSSFTPEDRAWASARFSFARVLQLFVSDPMPPNDHTLFRQPFPSAETCIALGQKPEYNRCK